MIWSVETQANRGGGVAISGSIPESVFSAGTCGDDRTTGYANGSVELIVGRAAEQAIAQWTSAPFDPGADSGQCCIGIGIGTAIAIC